MSIYQSDQKLSTSLTSILTPIVQKKQRCISNSLSVSSSNGSFLLYFTRGNDQRIYLVVINIGVDLSQKSVRVVPVGVKNSFALQKMQLQISQCRLMQEAFSVLAYDDRTETREKLVYVMSITLQNLDDKSQVQLVSVVGRQQGRVKDIRWHQDSILSLIVLTQTKLLTYKLDECIYQPVSQISLNDLQVASSTEIIKRNYFQKIAFSQQVNQTDSYSSLGKKLSLYLIANNASIYFLFPFVNSQVVIDEDENNRFKMIKTRPSISSRKEERGIKMMEVFRNSKVQQIREEGQGEGERSNGENINSQQREYSLSTPSSLLPKPQLFKLSPVTYSKTHSYPTITTVETFKVLTLSKHTCFLTVTRSKLTYHIKLQLYSQQPYQKLLSSSTYSHSQNFNTEVVSEIQIDARDFQQNISGVRVLSSSTMRNDLFIVVNGVTCYRLALDGLVNLLSNDGESRQQVSKLVDCDILFQSKTRVMTLCNNHNSIFLIRHSADSYFFQSIPLQSIQLKQRIRQTIQETENLFKKLVPTSTSLEQKQQKENNIPLPAFSQLKESTLIDIEKKLSTFSTDCRKSIQFRLEKIKRLYENINMKKNTLHRQQAQRNKLIELINNAEDNDKRIKQIMADDKSSGTRTEKDLKRRVKGIQKTLDEIKNVCEKEMKNVEQDQDKLETIQECQDQAQAVINQLQEVKMKLLQKKRQLKSRLRYA